MKPFTNPHPAYTPEADSGEEESSALPGRAWAALLLAASAQQPRGGRQAASVPPSRQGLAPSPASSASTQPPAPATASPLPEPACQGLKRVWAEAEAPAPPAAAASAAGKRRRLVSPLLLAALCRGIATADAAQQASDGLAAPTPNLTTERRQPLVRRPGVAAAPRHANGAFVPLRGSGATWPPGSAPAQPQPRPRHLHTALRTMLAPLPSEDARRLEEARRFLACF